MGLSITHIIIVAVVIVLLFGAGKIPRLMGDVAKGIKSFKAGLKDDSQPAEGADSPAQITKTDGFGTGTASGQARDDSKSVKS
ncbi:MAG: twin-arginine translocase TatA/TatE family subunit [Alphaproteobacteria bacterium]|nr:twin-arginine translocase TatA/TatE family subunit [Alphaproteobacteria bacterium]